MIHIKRVFFTTLLISVFIIPTSVYASSNTTQANSSSESFLTNFFSYFNIEKRGEDDQYNYTYYESNNSDWLVSLVSWFKSNKDGHYDDWDKEQCTNDKTSWSNDDGCLDSAEIWKRWYCL
ncbi:hypothetical protein [Neobacillus niacini]|uniref:hypothetical protein n=1 Tax=Neobacillus niacini TaxID=86668 RepID=UPI00300022AE